MSGYTKFVWVGGTILQDERSCNWRSQILLFPFFAHLYIFCPRDSRDKTRFSITAYRDACLSVCAPCGFAAEFRSEPCFREPLCHADLPYQQVLCCNHGSYPDSRDYSGPQQSTTFARHHLWAVASSSERKWQSWQAPRQTFSEESLHRQW